MSLLWCGLRAAVLLAVCAAGMRAQPFIFYRAIVNAASFAPPGLPNGSIARGSIFTIFGRGLGPAGSPPLSFPLRTTLGGVSIEVCQNANCVAAIPLFVSAAQVNAIMPSNAPLGEVSIRVTSDGQAGNYSPAAVVASSVGIFAVNTGGFGPGIVQNFVARDDRPINSVIATAKPGQVVTLWGTGLGPGLNADNLEPQAGDLPVNVEIFVGGKKVTSKLYSGRSPCCAGVDQVSFAIPADVPTGCYVPVQLRTAGVAISNTVTIAVSSTGGPCNDSFNPFEPQFVRGGALGIAMIERTNTVVESKFDSAVEVDAGAAYVAVRREAGSPSFYNPILSLPPVGTCTAWTQRGNVFADTPPPGTVATRGALDAGTPTLTGANGVAFEQNPKLPDVRSTPLEFDAVAAQLTVTGSGGTDIGGYQVAVSGGDAMTWTNRDELTVIDRINPLRITWSAREGSSTVFVFGGNYDPAYDGSGAFLCLAAPQAGAFSIPQEILAVAPMSHIGAARVWGRLYLGAAAAGGTAEFQAGGLDRGLALFLNAAGKTVSFR